VKSKQSTTTAISDHLTAGAAELRSRAQACRINAGNVSACRRLEAAAELLSPEPPEAEEALAESAPEPAGSRRRGKSPKPSRVVKDQDIDLDDDIDLGDVDDADEEA
jgi:hypothetical protein